jgi:chromosome segregation ATPase
MEAYREELRLTIVALEERLDLLWAELNAGGKQRPELKVEMNTLVAEVARLRAQIFEVDEKIRAAKSQ